MANRMATWGRLIFLPFLAIQARQAPMPTNYIPQALPDLLAAPPPTENQQNVADRAAAAEAMHLSEMREEAPESADILPDAPGELPHAATQEAWPESNFAMDNDAELMTSEKCRILCESPYSCTMPLAGGRFLRQVQCARSGMIKLGEAFNDEIWKPDMNLPWCLKKCDRSFPLAPPKHDPKAPVDEDKVLLHNEVPVLSEGEEEGPRTRGQEKMWAPSWGDVVGAR